MFAPFSLLPHPTAYLAFLLLNLVLLGVAVWMLWPWMRNLAKIYAWLPCALPLAFIPIGACLVVGQDSIILLFLLVIGARLLSRGRDFAADLIVGLGLFRFPLVLPIAGMFLLWKNWRFAAGFAASAITLCGASWKSMPNYVQALGAIDRGDDRADIVHSMANLHGLIFTSFKGAPTVALWTLLVALSFRSCLFRFSGWCPEKRA